MGKIFAIFLGGFAVSLMLAYYGFNSHLLHGLVGSFCAFLTVPIVFDKSKHES